MLTAASQAIRPVASFAWRTATVCVLTPLVVLLGVCTLAGLAVVGAGGMARSRATSLRRGRTREIRFHPRAVGDADRIAARQPA